MARVVLETPDLWRARAELAHQSQPFDWDDPIHMGGTPLIWRIDETEDGYAVVGRTPQELQELVRG